MEPIMPDLQLTPEADAALAHQALLYAGGVLGPAEAQAFEVLLGQDQKAREALSLAAQVAFAADPEADARPDPAYRERLRQRFAPRAPLWAWLCRPRSYPGHPAVWTGLGAAAAALVVAA